MKIDIKILRQVGVPMDMIMEAIDLINEKRKYNDRMRQRKHRTSHAGHAKTRESRDLRDNKGKNNGMDSTDRRPGESLGDYGLRLASIIEQDEHARDAVGADYTVRGRSHRR